MTTSIDDLEIRLSKMFKGICDRLDELEGIAPPKETTLHESTEQFNIIGRGIILAIRKEYYTDGEWRILCKPGNHVKYNNQLYKVIAIERTNPCKGSIGLQCRKIEEWII